MPRVRPPASSNATFPRPASVPPVAGRAAAISTRTMGSASPSLMPLSTLSSCRSRTGTSLRPTIAEANTGSVGASTAPTKNEVVQSNPTRKCVTSAIPTRTSGIPRPSARAGSRQALRNAGKETCIPSVNNTANNARSAVGVTTPLPGATWINPRRPSLTSAPPRRKSNDVDSTERAAKPDNNTATNNATPKTTTSTMAITPDQRRDNPSIRRPGFPALRQ